ncbi:DoxX family protein [Pseudoruegeria sp. SK021]|uniref:DoxX family protein n=1 Tax=Pseudoruegeria sp. SK021 TaxID=1933035 RepID=UPI000A21E74C|nr:DoxX family protein [Pseudoruegeria sp. SK021]OSP54248.1 hypothetical protein BV911_13385 [Pseudoruegeria sp. SK021]
MTALIRFHNWAFDLLERATRSWLLPSLARFVFAAVLLGYFWSSAMTKLGTGLFGFLFPSSGAYVQMFPKAMEAASYDVSQMSTMQYLIALFGTWAEFILPLLIVIGLFTRLAAIGMIGFITVQSLTDIWGHNADAATIGHWFDSASGALIMDQRTFWVFVLIVLIVRGAGPISVDRFVLRQR